MYRKWTTTPGRSLEPFPDFRSSRFSFKSGVAIGIQLHQPEVGLWTFQWRLQLVRTPEWASFFELKTVSAREKMGENRCKTRCTSCELRHSTYIGAETWRRERAKHFLCKKTRPFRTSGIDTVFLGTSMNPLLKWRRNLTNFVNNNYSLNLTRGLDNILQNLLR